MKKSFGALVWAATAVLVLSAEGGARAQMGAPAAAAAMTRPSLSPSFAPPASSVPPSGGDAEVDAHNDPPGYTPAETTSAATALHINGYVDLGFAKAQGDGTSFAPNDARVPIDYGSDAFATAVNSRGDVASTEAHGRFVNGFLPRSAGIGGHASFLLNTVNVDLRYQDPSAPVMVFSRVQLLPRLTAEGDASRFYVEQAFGRVMPFDTVDLALALGKFDSVFGVEYQENEANIRVGITPSLAARYTTGQSIGAKLFYRLFIAPLWSAVSLNAAATNSGNMVESLQGPDASLTGAPVLSARLGYELNLKAVQIKFGGSALRGPRNDQRDREALQTMWGLDLRVFLSGLALTGEYVHVNEDEGLGPKTTSLGVFPVASAFLARTFWGQLAYGWSVDGKVLRRVTPYARYERRHAAFYGFTPLTVERLTAGLRVDLWEVLILKGEVLFNGEDVGAPDVANNVYTSSVVYQW